MQTRLRLRYAGPAVEAGLMDVYEASANMIAFSEFVVVAAKSTFGEQIDARAQVAGIGRGSFVTELVFNVMGPGLTIFAATPPELLIKILKEAIDIWKHLKGSPPARIEHVQQEQTVKVTNNNGDVIQVQTQSLTLVINEKASECVERFIRKPLTVEGIDAVEIASEKDDPIASIASKEAYCFIPVAPSETVTDVTMKMSLVIEAPVFKEDNKWRFYDGSNTIYAAIDDKVFLARVDAGERFGKGDILVVDLRITQQRSGLKISAERIVVKVLEHRHGPEQSKLF